MADPDLQLTGGGHLDPEIRGEGLNFYQPFGTKFGLKIRRELGPLSPSPGSATSILLITIVLQKVLS